VQLATLHAATSFTAAGSYAYLWFVILESSSCALANECTSDGSSAACIAILLLISAAGIAYLTNSRVTAADLAAKTLTLASGDIITYQQLVIATGADVSKHQQGEGWMAAAWLIAAW
jgi:NADPH-dependent 2,4-dienoyl-CoA reductase/sulfur reductase-like enzyme